MKKWATTVAEAKREAAPKETAATATAGTSRKPGSHCNFGQLRFLLAKASARLSNRSDKNSYHTPLAVYAAGLTE